MSAEIEPGLPQLREKARQAYKELAHRPPLALAVGVSLFLIVTWVFYASPLTQVWRMRREYFQLKMEQADTRLMIQQLRGGQIPLLPPIHGMAEVLDRLNNLARSHQIQFLSVTPDVPHSTETKGLSIVSVEFQIEGGYRPIGEFLGALGKTPSLGTPCVHHVSIVRQESLLPRIRATVSIEFFLSEVSGGIS